MTKYVKIISVLIILIMTIMISCVTTNAFNIEDMDGESSSISVGNVKKVGNNIVEIIGTAGSIISVIVLVSLGIKYMMGSVEEKAEYKKTLMPYFIGAGLLFAASSVAGMIYNLANNL